ncbi:TIGR03986 family type III CRISPR-associated RAMP protein [Roseospira navarrensis]|uniref:TIGR03986 family CRISPR-associated RAMP protein n=1 Tax=Roseospira navarrensis TaxID=140058 RepID=A0A7X1ZGK5_9PROT|nr:TIGR03986 family CRISPR-associated RAMP protein [Roseospira navarrensis]MQX38173.1 TIGR03986 family CRISPR-associated RAMP protein [Roseospira navarrensis]
MPSEFLNTYHFVPVLDGGPTMGPTHDLRPVRDALRQDRAGAAEWGAWSHARWHDGHLSGRITCTLTTEDPLVIGAEQVAGKGKTDCTVVQPYLLDGKAAIPPTTLKGMLSSLVEAATNSAMRVLDDRALSVRQDTREALSAMGMVRRRPGTSGKGDGDWDLIPLTLPTLKETRGASGASHSFPIPAAFRALMRAYRWKPAHKVHVGHLEWKTRPGMRNPPPPKPDDDFQFMMDQGTYSADAPKTFLMDVVPLTLDPNGQSVVSDAKGAHVKLPKKTGAPAFLIGQKVRDGQPRRPVPEDKATDEQRRTMTRGVVRVMHHAERVADMPHTRWHEVFVPLTQDLERAPRLPIPADVVRRFHALADERTQTQSGAKDRGPMDALPFHPCGTRRADGSTDVRNAVRLKDGDLVFFGLAGGAEGQPTVTAVSFSSIWREGKGSVHDYVPAAALPQAPDRKALSPAELMFGFVEVRQGGKTKEDPNTVALKGRVRCTAARTDRGGDAFMTVEPSVRLKILASPKPPSPALYFRPKGDRHGFVPKADIDEKEPDKKTKKNEIRGRKMYLHPAVDPLGKKALDQAVSRTPANDPSNNQRNMVRPLKPGVTFTFHVDFDDLPPECLDLLLFACRPTTAFRHKLGMGKALGLGRVRIDVTRVEVIDRPRRYRTDDPFGPSRTHEHWEPGQAHDRLDPTGAARRVADQMDDILLGHLLGIGEPCHIGGRPVHPPYKDDQQKAFLKHEAGAEAETYRWFVDVYKTVEPTKHQYLRDIRLNRAGPDAPDPVASLDLPSLVPEGTTPAATGPTRPSRPRRASGPPQPPGPEITGTMKHYDRVKGRGYMAPDTGGKDIMVDQSVLDEMGMGSLTKNERVAVTAVDSGGKRVATFVRRLPRR